MTGRYRYDRSFRRTRQLWLVATEDRSDKFEDFRRCFQPLLDCCIAASRLTDQSWLGLRHSLFDTTSDRSCSSSALRSLPCFPPLSSITPRTKEICSPTRLLSS